MRLLLALAPIVGLCGTAHAHAILIESAPAAQATVAPGQVLLRLRFNSRVDPARSRLVLRSGTEDMPLTLDPTGPPDTLAGAVSVGPGAYVIRWQVLAVDGHITRGDVPFTVTGP